MEVRLRPEPLPQVLDEAVVELHQIQAIGRTQGRNDVPGDHTRARPHLEDSARPTIAHRADEMGQGRRQASPAGYDRPRGPEIPAKFPPKKP
jgi:hypothetical protein